MSSARSEDQLNIEKRIMDLFEDSSFRKKFVHRFATALTTEDIKAVEECLEDDHDDEIDPAAMAFANSIGARQLGAEELKALEYANLVSFFNYKWSLLSTAIPATALASLLGVSRTTVHDRYKNGQLLGVMDNNVLKFPDWQFDPAGPNGLVAGLSEVLGVMKCGNLAKISWLASPNGVFGNERPIDVLRRGKIEEVIIEAQSVGIV